MAGLGAGIDDFRPIVNRSTILDRVARGSGATRTPASMATRQIAPQGLGKLGRAIDEGVDGLAADGAQTRFVPRFQPARDLLGRPSLGQAVADESAQTCVPFKDRFTLSAQLVGSASVKRRVTATGKRVATQFPRNGGLRSAKSFADGAHRPAGGAQRADLISFVVRQMQIGSHGNTP